MHVKVDSVLIDVKATFYPHHDVLPPTPTASGAALMIIAGRDATYQLYCEARGNEPDTYIHPHTAVPLSDGLQFYALPPAIGG